MLVVVVLLMRVLPLRRQLMRLVVRLQTWVQRLELLQVLRCWDLVGAHRLRALLQRRLPLLRGVYRARSMLPCRPEKLFQSWTCNLGVVLQQV